ncbi:hypothetical protein [Rhizobium sp. L245/93]|uniref:hypothetical protein n=1 Tax=Rhizobium sp. L245/93 TaxID=2819998 RepID=UPI001AD9865F|nr:hypothetical protein [Rhizobium sp. L245/93]MBO9171597.1 hypothetical protein [Rhizobium sp. L245/93]
MKAPWQYLARLMSRQKTSDTKDGGRAGNVEVELQPAQTILLSSPEGAAGPGDMDPPVAGAQVPTAAATDGKTDPAAPALPLDETHAATAKASGDQGQSISDPRSPLPAGEVDVQSLKAPKTRGKGLRQVRGDLTPETAVGATETPVAGLSSPTNVLSNDVTDLDRDIKQLRDQLAQKLRVQNAQLRAMLVRFDRS